MKKPVEYDISPQLSACTDACDEYLASSGTISFREARLKYFHLKTLILAALAYTSVSGKQTVTAIEALEFYVSMGLVGEESRSFYLADAKTIDRLLARIEAVDAAHELHLGELYQGLLGQDLARSGGVYRLQRAKHSRDITGSYYTPRDLAWETTRRAIDLYIEHAIGLQDYSWGDCAGETRNRVSELLAQARVADLSCGAGEFMRAAVQYVSTYTDAVQAFTERLLGFDIDPIALLICFTELTCESGLEDIETAQRKIAGNLVLGNPLYLAESNTTFDAKAELFALGRSYAWGMAVDRPSMTRARNLSLVLGNPPWEKIRFEERKFFALINPEIASEPSKAARDKLVQELECAEPELHEYREQMAADYARARQSISRNSYISKIPTGELNTYTLFLVLGRALLDRDGVLALVLKSAVVTSAVNAALFQEMCDGTLNEVHLFENKKRIFAIDAREQFCVVIAAGHPHGELQVSFGNSAVEPLRSLKRVAVHADSLARINPDTRMLPAVSSALEYEMLASVSERLPSFREVFPQCHFGRILHLTSHARHIHKRAVKGTIPVFEGKFLGQHDLRFATFEGIPEGMKYAAKARARQLTPDEKRCSVPAARYHVEQEYWERISAKYEEPYMVCWRSLTSATNSRTMIASIAPFWPAIQSIQFLQTPNPADLVLIAGLFNSATFDFLVRLKIPGIDLTQSVVQQIPVPGQELMSRQVTFGNHRDSIRKHIERRVVELYSNEPDLGPLFEYVFPSESPAISGDQVVLVDEIDKLVFMAYGLDDEWEQAISLQLSRYYTDRD